MTDSQNPNEQPVISRRRRWLRRLRSIGTFLVLMAAMIAVSDYWRGRDLPEQALPAIPMTTLAGDRIDLDAMSQDAPVLVYFWATWCGICPAVSPSVDWLSPRHQVVSVALSSGDGERVRRYMQAKGYDFPVVNDPEGRIGQAWGIGATPSVAIIHRGEITSFTAGITTPPGLWLRLWLA